VETLLPALIAGVTALAVALLTSFLTIRRDARLRRGEEQRLVNMQYLNPLRIALAENYFRLQEIRETTKNEGKCQALLFVRTPDEILEKPPEWFNGEGTYLVSSSYYTACVFSNVSRLRRDIPYLRLARTDDTVLLSKLRRVSLAYLRHLGVFFATQDSIGQTMLRDNTVISYREFCELLTDPNELVWLRRLIKYYIVTGSGEYLERVDEALSSMDDLLSFLDEKVGAGASLRSILETEGRSKQG
jgi:hypothetical protein